MTPAMAELLNRYRRLIADMQRQLEMFDEGGMTTHTNGKDTTAESRERVCAQIESLQALVEKHDPEGFTVLR